MRPSFLEECVHCEALVDHSKKTFVYSTIRSMCKCDVVFILSSYYFEASKSLFRFYMHIQSSSWVEFIFIVKCLLVQVKKT